MPNVALFGEVPTVDFVTRGNSPSRSPAPHQPLPLTLLLRHDAAPSLSHHAFLPRLSLGRTPLPAYILGMRHFFLFNSFLFFLFFFSLIPADVLLLSICHRRGTQTLSRTCKYWVGDKGDWQVPLVWREGDRKGLNHDVQWLGAEDNTVLSPKTEETQLAALSSKYYGLNTF